jgi:hypothetical protein
MQESESMFKGDFASGEPLGRAFGRKPGAGGDMPQVEAPADSRRNVSRLARIGSALISLAILVMVAIKLLDLNPHELMAMVPRSAAFWWCSRSTHHPAAVGMGDLPAAVAHSGLGHRGAAAQTGVERIADVLSGRGAVSTPGRARG